jgi:Transposase, Mutator family
MYFSRPGECFSDGDCTARLPRTTRSGTNDPQCPSPTRRPLFESAISDKAMRNDRKWRSVAGHSCANGVCDTVPLPPAWKRPATGFLPSRGFPPSQWKSARTTNAIERLHEEFKRRIKTQTVLPSSDTAALLFWALLASDQIIMRKGDGWKTLASTNTNQPLDVAA